ncbi:hypothetical protein AVP42_00772 [Agromyces sp. NDB4Y10]|nr:hypothetical protein AVP42_00772 [Agromyces sp. NDB4Y10]
MARHSGSDRDLAIYEAQRAHELELNKATAAFEHAVSSPLFLLNGGAAVAFLTLLGAVSAPDSTLALRVEFVAPAVFAWVLGLTAGAACVGFGYRAQREFTKAVSFRRRHFERALVDRSPLDLGPLAEADELMRAGKRMQRWWWRMYVVSLAFFVVGVAVATLAVVRLPS